MIDPSQLLTNCANQTSKHPGLNHHPLHLFISPFDEEERRMHGDLVRKQSRNSETEISQRGCYFHPNDPAYL